MNFDAAHHLPFLRSQELYALKFGIDRRAAIHPDRFHDERHREEARKSKGPRKPDPEFWTKLERPQLLDGFVDGRSFRRLILINDAGIGKSYNCRWMLQEWNAPERDDLAFLIDIGSLASDVDFIATHLVPKIRTPEIAGHSSLNPVHLKDELDHLRQHAKISLIFDGLDQARPEHLAILARLVGTAGDWANCRIVIAGRPFAVENFQKLHGLDTWEFVQVAEFNEAQQLQVLGKLSDGRDRYDAVPQEAWSLFTVPRVLQYIHSLPEDTLTELRTVSDVYWQATGMMLTQAIAKKDVEPEDILRYRAVLGALAFGMYQQTCGTVGDLQPNTLHVPAKGMVKFRRKTYDRLTRALKRLRSKEYQPKEFRRDCRTLSKLNQAIHHGWFDVDQIGGTKCNLLWRNTSLQEFMAAYFACCWADATDLTPLTTWIVDPLGEKNTGFYWFWRYATEMPEDAIDSTGSDEARSSWQNTMAPLYLDRKVRSTEFLYRSWERMNGTAAQKEFLAEFPAFRASKSEDEEDVRRKKIADTMMAGFILLAAKGSRLRGDTGTFWMGAAKSLENAKRLKNYDPNDPPPVDSEAYTDESPPHRVQVSPFQLHKYCVRNVEYELFHEQHQHHRWVNQYTSETHGLVKKRGSGADDDCPVVNVSWYDSFVFSAWCGCKLPTEAQWEYACRAGTKTKYSLRGHSGEELSKKVCNCGGNRGYTLPVAELCDNRWGFFQMHGNVFELCQDWYDSEYYAIRVEVDTSGPSSVQKYRTVRGGSWSGSAGRCRASYRIGDEPVDRGHYLGMRLASCLGFG